MLVTAYAMTAEAINRYHQAPMYSTGLLLQRFRGLPLLRESHDNLGVLTRSLADRNSIHLNQAELFH